MFSIPRCSALCFRRLGFPTQHFLRAQSTSRHSFAQRHKQSAISAHANVAQKFRNSLPNLTPWVYVVPTTLLVLGGTGVLAYNYNQPFRHTALAVVRCSRIAEAAILGAIDYKMVFAKTYESEESRLEAYSQCHTRSAQRVLRALLANGGIFIKLGQHMASVAVLPPEWTRTMRPLQDQCEPTEYENLERMFVSDIGVSIAEYFDEFDPKPIGVASLAQVHVGRLKGSGEKVAVKLQHPHLQEFCEIDMEMVEVSLGWIQHWFPEFEFTWLGEEMRENLPKEMDFVHEKRNAERAAADFENVRTSMYIPKVKEARKRILVMEYIQGGRVDDLVYLSEHNIDRNKVALELARIFCQMVHINGWFHADPHPGNLLIRPAQPDSKSPYNFEIVLLDHGLYFDLDTALRINYSKWWLALIAPASEQVVADRKKYAKLVGNIDEDLYPVFEAAITGRAALEGSRTKTRSDSDAESDKKGAFSRGRSMIDLSAQTEVEMEAIRNAVVQQEGLLLSVFDVLRRVPRRVLMVLKLNDLTRSLDRALATTHANIRVFLITAKYCTFAVWLDESERLVSEMRRKGLSSMSLGLLRDYFWVWWRYEKMYRSLELVEWWMDTSAQLVTAKAWMRGLLTQGGLHGAHRAAAGLA
ncbi:ABC1-domain-containing protein [Dichomitus squalens]|uniref:ABC1-domain-containing protein n=1 Tax=Dichomitus squalens TaxID=114155 RepID=A0A4Q9MIH7_9APHY|nr:ABC1-domain-containing protein [Dichomitus squalens]